MMDCTLKDGYLRFDKCDVTLWEEKNLALMSTGWICVRDIPVTFWHDKFFTFLGVEFGHLLEVSPSTIQRINLSEARFKLNI